MMVWPLPALLTWSLAWGVFALARALHMNLPSAFAAALCVAGATATLGRTPWRRMFMLAGFPLSLLASGATDVALPAWAWLLPLALLAALYPLNAWRDAPLFPTPASALAGLSAKAPLPEGAVVMDAGCGLGAGLRELRREYPATQILGLEWSWPLVLLCRLRCRFARVRRADIWAADWSGCELVYLFQRPESMPRAMAKAARELHHGAWLVSLEFEANGWAPQGQLTSVQGKPVWLYQAPFRAH